MQIDSFCTCSGIYCSHNITLRTASVCICGILFLSVEAEMLSGHLWYLVWLMSVFNVCHQNNQAVSQKWKGFHSHFMHSSRPHELNSRSTSSFHSLCVNVQKIIVKQPAVHYYSTFSPLTFCMGRCTARMHSHRTHLKHWLKPTPLCSVSFKSDSQSKKDSEMCQVLAFSAIQWPTSCPEMYSISLYRDI